MYSLKSYIIYWKSILWKSKWDSQVDFLLINGKTIKEIQCSLSFELGMMKNWKKTIIKVITLEGWILLEYCSRGRNN